MAATDAMDTTSDGQLALRTVLLTSIAMVAFASNSLLCRLALQHAAIDAASFSIIRLVSGAVVLAILARAGARRAPPARVDWAAATMLFAYVAFFSFAYLTLSAGTGALILFGAVQITMLGAGPAPAQSRPNRVARTVRPQPGPRPAW